MELGKQSLRDYFDDNVSELTDDALRTVANDIALAFWASIFNSINLSKQFFSDRSPDIQDIADSLGMFDY
jgi:hypothetical protein